MYKNKFKNYFSKSNQLILLTTVFHLFFIGFYPVNDEFIFPVGAKLLETYDVNQIKFYFDFNANTLGFPIIIFLLSKALSINYYLTAKLLSLIGIILICIGSNSFLKLINLKNYKNKHILFLLILLNPLVFIFSFRGTPDFFSASLAFFSITCFIINKKFYLKLIYLIFFSFAVIIKPFTAILVLILYFEFNFKSYFTKKNIFIIIWSLSFFIIPVLYFNINYILFDFYMVPDQFSLIEKFDINIFLIKFISYIGFINLFVIFFSFEFQKKYLPKNFLNFLIYLFISFILSRFFMKDVGEINFGFISNYLNPKFFYFILSFSFFLFFNNIYNIIINRTIEKKIFYSFLIIIILSLILSIFHPAQRYLLSVLPILLIIFFIKNKKNYLNILTIIMYIIINIPLFANNYYTSKNIRNVIIFLQTNKIIHETNPGFLGQHSLNYFINFDLEISKSMNKTYLFDKNKKYIVTDDMPINKSKIIFVSKTNNIFKKNKNLYVLEVN